jgi:Hemerythrin HHE cation binding domain
MPTDFSTLLQRDHVDLQKELTLLLDPMATAVELRGSLDGVRLGLTAHAEAEDIVLGRFEGSSQLGVLIAQARSAHLAQEGALSALVSARPGSAAWRDRAHHLRDLIQRHAAQAEQLLLPGLRLHLSREAYAALAGAFATERLRQLAMLQPSAPVYIDFALADARAS